MSKKIILVHGRSYKPNKKILKRNWIDATQYGINRDFGEKELAKFNQLKPKIEMAYYGDLSNDFLSKHGDGLWTEQREKDDIADRKEALLALKKYGARDFTKRNYNKIRDLSDVLKEAAANILSGPLSIFGIGDDLVEMVAPDMGHYWNLDDEFGSNVRWRLTEILTKAMGAGEDILLVAHSLGTIVCYDVLWKISHYGEYKKLREKGYKNITLITIGSPLGDENVKDQLKGADASGYRRYPQNIKRWINFAAEDDFISHDSTVKNDFRDMKKFGLDPNISDKEIYNMSIREGNSNPHHSTGYLIHPKFSQAVVSWLG